jgi:putative membrane protein (TIGR04086 family)
MAKPAAFAHLHWGRVLAAGLLAELVVFVVVFPTLYLFGQTAFLASILIASALCPLIFAFWVGRRVESRFVLHGALVGLVAALFYMILAWGQPQPLLYKIAHVLKVAGGMAGGALSRRRRPALAGSARTDPAA